MRQVSAPSAGHLGLPAGWEREHGRRRAPFTEGPSRRTGRRFVWLLWFFHDLGRRGCGKRNCHSHHDGGRFPLSSLEVTHGTADGIFSQESFSTDWNRRNQRHHVAFRNYDFLICPSSIDFGRGVVHVKNPDLPCGAPVENSRVQYDSPAPPRTTSEVYLELDQFTSLIREFFFIDHLLTSQILVRRNRGGLDPSRAPVRGSALPRHSES